MNPYKTSWEEEDEWWEQNFASRPYAKTFRYEELRPAYQYGYISSLRNKGRKWDDIKESLRSGWDRFEGKGPGGAAWENIKDAVRDAWDRIAGRHDVDTGKMSAFEADRLSGSSRR